MLKSLYTLSSINEAASRDYKAFVNQSEDIYTNSISNLTDKIIETPENKIIMVAGPSASGKTTSALKLSKAIYSRGVDAYTIS
ncbi:MAG: nucleoside kinase, partial [Clostridia bacterium]|nr:nucleoside kinase [Clostridia bacterium]